MPFSGAAARVLQLRDVWRWRVWTLRGEWYSTPGGAGVVFKITGFPLGKNLEIRGDLFQSRKSKGHWIFSKSEGKIDKRKKSQEGGRDGVGGGGLKSGQKWESWDYPPCLGTMVGRPPEAVMHLFKGLLELANAHNCKRVLHHNPGEGFNQVVVRKLQSVKREKSIVTCANPFCCVFHNFAESWERRF